MSHWVLERAKNAIKSWFYDYYWFCLLISTERSVMFADVDLISSFKGNLMIWYCDSFHGQTVEPVYWAYIRRNSTSRLCWHKHNLIIRFRKRLLAHTDSGGSSRCPQIDINYYRRCVEHSLNMDWFWGPENRLYKTPVDLYV